MDRQVLAGRYRRNFSTLSAQDQERLFFCRISLVGLGGLGGPLLEMLARMGFGRKGCGWIRVADGDMFEASNLNRQLFCLESNLGLPKTQEAVKRIQAVNSEVNLQVHKNFLQPEELPAFIHGADIVLDALGDLPTKLALRRAAAQAGLPVITAAIGGWVGFISTLLASDRGDTLLRIMDTGVDGAELRLGVLAPTAWFVAALQCRETVALACGKRPLFHGRMHIVDLTDATWEKVLLEEEEACAHQPAVNA
ncbi:MAG TPA: hypothetical protein ENN39_08145 [Desulfonatronum sp.]|nr:hypothetical protein [Desulfonatronum sp.]